MLIPTTHHVERVACCVGCFQTVRDAVSPMLSQQVRRVEDGSDHGREALDAVAVERARHGEQVHSVTNERVRILQGLTGRVKVNEDVA